MYYVVLLCSTFNYVALMSSETSPTPADSKNAPISIRLGEMEGLVRKRTPSHAAVSSIVRRDLARYYEIIHDERNRLGLTTKEAAALVDGVGYRSLDGSNAQLMWAMVEAHLRDTPTAGFSEAERAALSERLRKMRTSELLRLVDSIERFRIVWQDEEWFIEEAAGNWDPKEEAFYEAELTHWSPKHQWNLDQSDVAEEEE